VKKIENGWIKLKQYPIISSKINRGIDVYAFDKLDGSNIRAEWHSKKGFWKFGSRNRLLGSDQPTIIEAQTLIEDKYAEDLGAVFENQRYSKVVAFFEFYGPNSFAGNHKDELHDVLLFDISPHKNGILPPNKFIKLYQHLDIPKVILHGKISCVTDSLIRIGHFEDITFEGVVCKANDGTMFKVKTAAWLDKLKNFCGKDKKLLEKLK